MSDESVFPNIRESNKRAFLTAYALTGHVARSCAAAGISTRLPYTPGWRRDESFQEAYEEARLMSSVALEDEARRRAIDGDRVYKFDKDGDPLRHPDECECGHPRGDHALAAACTAEECSCSSFHGRPYYELKKSDVLLIFLTKGALPERYRELKEVRSTLAKLDLSLLPNDMIARIAAGEPIESVLAAGASDAGLTPGEIMRGALKPGEPE